WCRPAKMRAMSAPDDEASDPPEGSEGGDATPDAPGEQRGKKPAKRPEVEPGNQRGKSSLGPGANRAGDAPPPWLRTSAVVLGSATLIAILLVVAAATLPTWWATT